MSMDKAIASGKEHRKQRRSVCQGKKGCVICQQANEYKTKKQIEKAEADHE